MREEKLRPASIRETQEQEEELERLEEEEQKNENTPKINVGSIHIETYLKSTIAIIDHNGNTIHKENVINKTGTLNEEEFSKISNDIQKQRADILINFIKKNSKNIE